MCASQRFYRSRAHTSVHTHAQQPATSSPHLPLLLVVVVLLLPLRSSVCACAAPVLSPPPRGSPWELRDGVRGDLGLLQVRDVAALVHVRELRVGHLVDEALGVERRVEDLVVPAPEHEGRAVHQGHPEGGFAHMYSRLLSSQPSQTTGRRPTSMASSVAKASGSEYDSWLARFRSGLEPRSLMPHRATGRGKPPSARPVDEALRVDEHQPLHGLGKVAAKSMAMAPPSEAPTSTSGRPPSCCRQKACRCARFAAALVSLKARVSV